MVRRVRATSEVDPKACPICGGGNECAKANASNGPCWCRSKTFSFELLARAGTGKACICEQCLRRYTQDPEFVPFPSPHSPQETS